MIYFLVFIPIEAVFSPLSTIIGGISPKCRLRVGPCGVLPKLHWKLFPDKRAPQLDHQEHCIEITTVTAQEWLNLVY